MIRRGRVDYKWWVFGTIALGTFVSVVDQSGVGLALPRIADHFDSTIPEVQWVALGYVLTTGSLLMPMGRLSDIVGRKRVYTAGFIVFTVAALLAGASTALLMLVLFKVLQGVGAAMVQSNGMAIVTSTFSPSERGKAIGMFMTVVGLGAIAGPVVGGAVVGMLGWRFVFFMGLPFGVASIISGLLFLEGREGDPGGRPQVERPAFDWAGAALSAGALAAFLLVMTSAHRLGWDSPFVAGGFVVVAGTFAAFIWWERKAPDPMLALDLFRHRLFSMGNSISFLSFMASSSVFFLMPFYLQNVLGYSPEQAGLILVPAAISFAVIGPIAGRLSDKYGWWRFSTLGLVASGLSFLLLSQLSETAPVELVISALALQGMGMGIFYSPNASAILSTVPPARYGIATAFMNMMRNTGNVTGVGLATAIVTAVMASLGYEPSLEAVSAVGGEDVRGAFTQGLQLVYLVMSGLIGLGLVLSILMRRAAPWGAVPSKSERRGTVEGVIRLPASSTGMTGCSDRPSF